MFQARRLSLEPVGHHADSNIRPHYAIEQAAWIWHPQPDTTGPQVVRFHNDVAVEQPTTVRVHLSADQRYEWSIDGIFVGMGPDRGDPGHWHFASYELTLAPGRHRFEVLVWWLGCELKPAAQMTLRGGFILAAEGMQETLNTGSGPWHAALVPGLRFAGRDMGDYHVIGPEQHMDVKAMQAGTEALTPVVVAPPLGEGVEVGIISDQWHLHPSPLPEMRRHPFQAGCIRAVRDVKKEMVWNAADCDPQRVACWQPLAEGQAVTVPANRTIELIWDLEAYLCGYPELRIAGGSGRVSITWAEALYEADEKGERSVRKGHRDQVAGKWFLGFGDHFDFGGGPAVTLRSHWWRSGRFLCLRVQTDDQPLNLEQVRVLETGYPWGEAGRFVCDDEDLNATIPMMVRGLQACSHETWMDCPFYEQLMYAGDTRLQMLTARVLYRDERLTHQGLALFDYSRWKTGFVAERYPSAPYQLSLTFSMIWISMVCDAAWWQGDLAATRQCLTGVRCLLEHLLALLPEDAAGQDYLLGPLPGWSFVDWVDHWQTGYAPGSRDGSSAPVNLLLLMALRDAARLEEAIGDAHLAQRYGQSAARLSAAIRRVFWCPERKALADETSRTQFSEHTQSLALLNDVLAGEQRATALQWLVDPPADLTRATVYFSHYVFEALYRAGRGDRLLARCDFWKALKAQGFLTPVEQPEPSRSDCHAWGAHPLFHFHASLAGIRPDAPGFARVRIAPVPGDLRHLETRTAHPQGWISAEMHFENGACRARIELPGTLTGSFHWAGKDYPLQAGVNEI